MVIYIYTFLNSKKTLKQNYHLNNLMILMKKS